MLRRLIALAVLIPVAAQANSLASMQVATELSVVIASETVCDFKVDSAKAQAFIERKVPVDDLGFAPMLNLMIEGNRHEISSKSGVELDTHCFQTRRAAEANDLLAD
ncbi:MAG: hypothetical protein AAF192_00255 [Pseudomonadota bacterium]